MHKRGINIKKFNFILIGFLLLLQGCIYAVRYDGTYKGKVIDADTVQPLEGVVVLGVWYTVLPTAAGGVSSYYDAKETLTDKNGEFEISGMGLRVMSNLAPMDVLIFKAGYGYIGMGPWESFKLDGGLLMGKIKWDGNKAIIPLKKLTMEERKKQGSPDFPSQSSGEKMKFMLEEINKDRTERGLDPYRLGGSRP